MSSKNLIITIVVIVLVLGAGAFVMMNSNKQVAPTPTKTIAPVTSTAPAAESTPGAVMLESGSSASPAAMTTGSVKEFTVTGSNFKFAPNVMQVKKGDKVKITFKNSGGMHDFIIDELNVATKQLQSGSEEVVEFTADTAGTFEYYCSVGNHRAMGMKGTLTVQ